MHRLRTLGIATLLATLATSLATVPAASAHFAGSTNLHKLVIGDGRVSTTAPHRGWVYSCMAATGGGPTPPSMPWRSGSSWDYTAKPTAAGSVDWSNARISIRVGSQRIIVGNGLPSHTTGTFPMTSTDPASVFGANPFRIKPVNIDLALPTNPRKSSRPGCLPGGPIGVLTTGAVLFNALDAQGYDAPAREIVDHCGGHPDPTSMYHYHALPSCINTGRKGHQSKVIGWALDGYPITGPLGPHGVTMTNEHLDKCHGRTSTITLNGKHVRMYHYVATMQYPYTLGCYHGTSVLQRH